MKTVAIVAAHFPPSNLAGVHRARLWAQHLHEFGWKPIVVTTHWRHYEEQLDWELCQLLDPELEIIRTAALPTRPVRLVGDVGVRGLPWHLTVLRRLLRDRRIDFLHITVPSFYSALLGELIYRRQPIPFGIDYIDPWVQPPADEPPMSKAWLSMKLADVLEPWAVRNASLVTGITKGYFAGVLERNPHLNTHVVTAAMPYGNSATDYDIVAAAPRRPYLFDADDGSFHMVYAGAMLPKAHDVLDRFLAALASMRTSHPDILARLRVHFIGMGSYATNGVDRSVMSRAAGLGLDGIVSEHRQRIPYVDVLNHLTAASAILILGSTEPHYSPSKVYQSIQAKRPVFALLHEASSAVQIIETSRAGTVVTLSEENLPEPGDLAARLGTFVSDPRYDAKQVEWRAFEKFSARESTRALASAMDEALKRFASRHN